MSFRVRLAVWYTLVLAALLTVFAVGLYGTMYYTLTSEVDRDVTARARELAGLIRVLESPWRQRTMLRLPRVGAFADDLFVQVVTPQGEVVARSANLEGAQLPFDPDERIDPGAVTRVVNGTRLRLYNLPVWVEDRPVGTIQVARSLHRLDFTLLRLRVAIAGGTLVTLAVTALMAGWLAGSFTRPINRITAAALRIGTTHDLTERVPHQGPEDEIGRFAAAFNQMLDRLQAAYIQLSEAFQRQRQFLADVSHQLRTPLTVMRGHVDLLRQAEAKGDPALRGEALAELETETGRMSQLVGDLLTLARADAGKQAEKHPVLIGEVLLDAARQARVVTGARQLAVAIPDEVANTAVLGHEGYLQQLFAILLDNAVKYTLPGGRIRLSAALRGDRVRVEVADDGIGIPPADQPRLFTRFHRGGNVRHITGAGLGLAIAHWIVTDHGGTIAVTSQEGAGSTFAADLPVFPGTETLF